MGKAKPQSNGVYLTLLLDWQAHSDHVALLLESTPEKH